eukprot:TRINITY_DN1622_c0_g1_i5.p1 TRINITY_DN1622_c0_g1~~TRINITY_DN1622_c0_g1_i5.p1  ORF type:complete len:638 (-),score=137.30 TRINITY_DN1622_c0_g1_i5:978-2891(-)
MISPALVQAFSEASRLCKQYNLEIAPLEFKIIGTQSSGKTSFIEACLKFPCGYVDRGTATRRPVCYTLIHDELQTEPQISVNIDGIRSQPRKEELMNIIRIEMIRLRRLSSFDSTPIYVTVSYSEVVNMVFVDYPGLITSPDTDEDRRNAEIIENMIRDLNSDSSSYFVPIVKASEDPTTTDGLNILKNLFQGEDWLKRSLVLVNRMDTVLNHLRTTENMRDFLTGAQNRNVPLHYVSLNPENTHIDRETMNFETLEERIGTLMDAEEDMIERHMSEHNINIPNGLLDVLFIRNAMEKLSLRWQETVKDSLPEMLRSMRQRIADLENAMETLREQVIERDFDTILETLSSLADDFRFQFLACQEGAMVENIEHRKEHSKILPQHSFLPTQGKLLDEEIQQANAPDWEFYIETDELLSDRHMGGQHLQNLASVPLKGTSALHRIKMIFSYFLVAREFDNLPEEVIYQMGYSSPSARGSSFNVEKVVSQLVRREIQAAGVGIDWLRSIMKTIVKDTAELVTNYLLESKYYSFLKPIPAVKEALEASVNLLLEEQLSIIENKWSDDVLTYSHQLREDIGVRTMMSVANAPLSFTILGIDKYSQVPVRNNERHDSKSEMDIDSLRRTILISYAHSKIATKL